TSAAKELSWSTRTLIVFFISRISPRTSTVIFLDRSPLAMAVVTSAMLRTCAVRLPAMNLTLSVRSFHSPATPLTSASTPRVPAGRAIYFRREGVELVHQDVDRILDIEDFAAHVHGDFLGQVAVGDGRRDFGNVTHLRGQITRHRVDVIGQVFPGPGHTLDLG